MVFVAVDEARRPIPVPEFVPRSEEKKRWLNTRLTLGGCRAKAKR